MTPKDDLERFIDGLGLRYFKGYELTPYWSQVRKGVRNSVPPESLWPNIVPTILVLDELRHRLKASITLTSTYRRPAYNAAVGGEANSFHMQFKAIDFTCAKGKPKDWARELRKLRGTASFQGNDNSGWFTFHGGIGTYPTFVHVDTGTTYDRNW